MNIGLFTDTYFPQINGVATSVHILEKELTAMGHSVYIFTTTNPNTPRKHNVFRMPSMPFVFLPTHRVGLFYPPRDLLKIRKLNLDIIHTHSEFSLGIFGKVVSEVAKVPLVHTYHTLWEDYVHYVARGHLITPKMARRYSRYFCNMSRAVIAPTDKARNALLSYNVERPIRVIPTGLDFAPFNPAGFNPIETAKLRKSLGILPSDKVVLILGRIAKEKNMDVVVRRMPEIIKRVPDAKLVVVGDGPARAELQTLAKTLGFADRAVFTGSRPWTEIGKYYQLGDIFVSASTSETQGLTYAEAIASGLPVVAKYDKSIADLVRHNETGYTFNNDNELPALAARVLNDPAEAKRITAAATAAIAHLSGKRFGQNVERLYREVVKAYPKRTRAARRTFRLR